MRIVWFSRHDPTPRQRAALAKAFGSGACIVHDRKAFSSAADILSRYRESEADELVVVAPLTVVQALVRHGLKPIWAEMALCPRTHPEREVTIHPRHGKPRHYRFVRFARVTKVDLGLQPVEAAQQHSKGE